MKRIMVFAFAVLLGGLMMFGGIKFFGFGIEQTVISPSESSPVHFTNYVDKDNTGMVPADFTQAAEKTVPVVVHIRSAIRASTSRGNDRFEYRDLPAPFRDFFGIPEDDSRRPNGDRPMRQGSGSGVIISSDGYIVTNNHVIDDADEVSVTLNDGRTFDAEVIGVDPSTDIALIKIKEKNLPSVQFANSDQIKVGEWAVAVGNPFSLSSTVTAGIVSATARNINIMRDRTSIEAFIQTDAAVNPGNSGGALVDLHGNLIGINTAIASPTGAYSGYAFAVPSNIVNKVVADLKEYGVVQRGFIGAQIRGVNSMLAEEKGLTRTQGVYVDSLTENSSAAEAGIKVGDVIVAVNDHEITSSPQLLERLGRHRPGDKVALTIDRKGSEKRMIVTLKNRSGNTDPVTIRPDKEVFAALGAKFETLSDKELERYGVDGGVKVAELGRGKLSEETDIREGFVITEINRQSVRNSEELAKILAEQRGGVMLEGFYLGESDQKHYYAFGM